MQSLPLRLTAVALAVVVAGCHGVILEGQTPTRLPRLGTGHIVAGAGKRDITPLPGFSMGGHAIGGKMSRGHWTRLFARSLYIEDATGTPLVLVACDLWAMPGGLIDVIATRLARDPELRHIGRENLLIAATHTHHSQGNFCSSAACNEFAQPIPGFDPDLFEFLVRRIVAAIAESVQHRTPARLIRSEDRLDGFFRNRSLEPFLLNPEAQGILAANADLRDCEPAALFPDARACRAVDPRLTVLRAVTAADNRLIGAAGFLGAHPTVMSHDLEVYSGDIFGAAALLAEAALRRDGAEGAAPVVALFNGPQGDITTTWERQDRQNVMRLAEQVSASIRRQATGGGIAVAGPIAVRFGDRPLADTCFVDAGGEQRCTADTAVAGASAFGGAEDGRTVLEDVGFREGRRASTRREYGSKLPALDLDFGGIRLGLTRWLANTSTIPRTVPLAVYRLGDLLLATLPGEFTTTMGRRIQNSLEGPVSGARRALLVGLAGEYVNYFTTPEEYDLQYYEAGMTMYGQAAGELVRDHLVHLVAALDLAPTAAQPRTFRHDAGKRVQFGTADVGSPLYRPDDGLSIVLQDLATGDPRRDFPCVCWDDGLARMSDVLADKIVLPEIRIIDDESDATVVLADRRQDTSGLDLVSVVTSVDPGTERSRWCSFWMPPEPTSRAVAFVVRTTSGEFRRSPAFAAGYRSAQGCFATEHSRALPAAG